VEKVLNVKTNKADLCVDVRLETQEIHMSDVCKVLAFLIPNVRTTKLARITIALTLAQLLVDKELIAVLKIM